MAQKMGVRLKISMGSASHNFQQFPDNSRSVLSKNDSNTLLTFYLIKAAACRTLATAYRELGDPSALSAFNTMSLITET